MKLVIIYRPDSEHGRAVEDFARDYQRWHDTNSVELLNIDTREGSAMATLYDVMEYPAIMAIRNDGSINKFWQGETLPLMDEVASYVNS